MNFIQQKLKAVKAELLAGSLARHSNLSVEKVIWQTDTAGPHAEIFDACRKLIADGSYEKVIEQIAAFEKSGARILNGEYAHAALADLLIPSYYHNEGHEESIALNTLKKVETWYRRDPKSPFAGVALAKANEMVGWYYRGGDYANKVSQKGWEKFSDYGERAKKAFLSARQLHAHHWYFATSWQDNALTDCDNVDQIFDRFSAACRALPLSPGVYTSMAFALLPRWYGDFEQLEAFATKSADETEHKVGQSLYAVINHYVVTRGEEYTALHYDRERFAQGLKDWLAVNPNDYLQSAYAEAAYMSGLSDLALDFLEPLKVIHEDAIEEVQSYQFMNSMCREFTGR